MEPPADLKGILFRAGTIGVAAVLALLAADFALRPLLRQRLYVRPHKMLMNPWPVNEALGRYERSASFKGKIHGDLAVMSGDPRHRVEREVIFRTDELGFRNEPGRAREANRLILLGDSMGAGTGGSQEDTLTFVLRESHQIQNYNLSIGQSTLWQELMTLKYEFGRISLAPDAAVFWLVFSGNDFDGGSPSEFELRYNNAWERLAVRLSTAYRRSPIRQLLQPEVDRSSSVLVRQLGDELMLFYGPHVQRATRSAEELRALGKYQALRQVVEEMVQFCASQDLALHLVLVPSKAETYSWLIEASNEPQDFEARHGASLVMRQWSEDFDVPFLDLTPHFSLAAYEGFAERQELLYWRDDTHWNGHGQRLAARVIADFLRGIEVIQQAPFLTEDAPEARDILYDNAARFLRQPEVMERLR